MASFKVLVYYSVLIIVILNMSNINGRPAPYPQDNLTEPPTTEADGAPTTEADGAPTSEPGSDGGGSEGQGNLGAPSGAKADCPRSVVDGTCLTFQMDPFHKPNLRERLDAVLKPIPIEKQDPRFPVYAELHNRNLLPNIKPIVPRADVDFLRLHYDSRGDFLPQVKRLDERPGPLYSFQGQGNPCEPPYTFEKWPGKLDAQRPPKEKGHPIKPLREDNLCIRT